ncbi:MAG: PAS domain-containing protein, partial [Anaerolineae bacterium]|nr:PAS domain-containing protein [Anaerolineae bacterium]
MKLSTDLPHPPHHVTIIDHDSAQAALLHSQIVTALTDIAIDYATITSVDELPIALQSQFDVIICDEACLALAGNDCLRQIQLRRPGAAVIVTATTGTLQDAVDVMRHGARGFVEKADTPRLIRLIREELASTPLPSSSAATIIAGELTSTIALVELLDDMVDAAACINLRDRTIVYASAAFESVFGYPLRRLIEEPEFYRQVLHPDDFERVTAAMQDCLQNGSAELEHRIIWPDGQVRWLHRRARVSFDSAGRPLLLKDSARDITARKQIEHALAAVEAIERALLAAVPDIIFHLDAENVIMDVRGTIPDRGIPMLRLAGETMQSLLTKPLFPT